MRQQDAAGQFGMQNLMGAQAGLSGLQGMFNLAQAPFQAQWNPLINAAGVTGAPQWQQQQPGLGAGLLTSFAGGAGQALGAATGAGITGWLGGLGKKGP